MTDGYPTWMSMARAATYLGVQPPRLREMVEAGEFPAQYVKKSGDRYIFHPHAINPPPPQAEPLNADVLRQVSTAAHALNTLLRALTGTETEAPMA